MTLAACVGELDRNHAGLWLVVHPLDNLGGQMDHRIILPERGLTRARERPAEGSWLVVDIEGEQLVQPGSVIVVTEGRRVVAFFTVEQVTPGA